MSATTEQPLGPYSHLPMWPPNRLPFVHIPTPGKRDIMSQETFEQRYRCGWCETWCEGECPVCAAAEASAWAERERNAGRGCRDDRVCSEFAHIPDEEESR